MATGEPGKSKLSVPLHNGQEFAIKTQRTTKHLLAHRDTEKINGALGK